MNTRTPLRLSPTDSALRRGAWPAGILVLALALPSVAAGDWLVTVDGERIETRGAWRVEGQRVVFHLPNGTLTSLRSAQVDLDRSREASAPAAPKPPPTRTPSAPVLVLTDSNVPRAPAPAAAADPPLANGPEAPSAAAPVSELAPGEAAPEAPATGAPTTEAPEASAVPPPGAGLELEVTSWREETEDDGLRFLGTVENGSPDYATLITVEVALYDEAGGLLDTRTARLGTRSLAPGSSTTFDVRFDGAYAYGDVFFTADARPLRTRGPARAAPPGNAEEPAASDEPPPDR